MKYKVISDKIIYNTENETEAFFKAKLFILHGSKKSEIWYDKKLTHVFLSPLCKKCNDKGFEFIEPTDADYIYETVCNCEIGQTIREELVENAKESLEKKWLK